MSSPPTDSWTRWVLEGVRSHEQARSVDLPSPDRYERLEELGRGGMGIVYRAIDRELKRPVALKLLRDPGEKAGTGARRFRREAEAAARLSHPNLVPIFDLGEMEGRPYLVMELVDGVPLDAFLARRAPPIRERVGLLAKVAEGVAHAHDHGIVHRDLKPSNILVTPSGEPRVLDFGLAHLLGPAMQVTGSRELVGTPAFMAPEQVRGGGAGIGPETDVYALAVILYGMIADRFPYSQKTPDALFHAILTEEPPSPRKLNARVHPDLETICLKAMEKDPRRRYPTAREFRDDLLRYLAGEPIDARPPSRLYRFRRGLAKRRALVAAIGGAVLAATVAWGGFSYRSAREESATARRSQKEREDAERLNRWKEEVIHPLREEIEKTRMASYSSPRLKYAAFRARLEKELEKLKDRCADPLFAVEPILWSTLGMGYYVIEDADRAEPTLLKARDLGSEDPGVVLALARLYLHRAKETYMDGVSREEERTRKQELHDRAAELLRNRAASTELEQQVSRAYRAIAAGAREEALEICVDGIRRFEGEPGSEEFWLIQGVLTEGVGSIEALSEALAIRPHYAEAYWLRGIHRGRGPEPETALADFAKALEINPRYAGVYRTRGTHYFRMKRFDEAERDFAQALAIRPYDPLTLNMIGFVRLEKGDLEGAAAAFDTILARDPTRASAFVYRGNIRKMQCAWEKAILDYDRAIALIPDDAIPYRNRAGARLALKDFEGALRDLDRALLLSPLDALIHLDRGTVHILQNDRDEAISDFSRAIKVDPTCATAFLYRGELLERKRDFEEALRDYQEAARLRPSDVTALWSCATVRVGLGDRTGAVEDLEHAIRIAPADWNRRQDAHNLLDSLRKK